MGATSETIIEPISNTINILRYIEKYLSKL